MKAEGDGDDRGWDCWMASLTRWTWVWVNSGSWKWTGKPGVLQSMRLQRVGLDWATELSDVFLSFLSFYILCLCSRFIPCRLPWGLYKISHKENSLFFPLLIVSHFYLHIQIPSIFSYLLWYSYPKCFSFLMWFCYQIELAVAIFTAFFL